MPSVVSTLNRTGVSCANAYHPELALGHTRCLGEWAKVKVRLGEHGKRVAPKAPAAQAESSRATKVHRDRSLRWGPLTAETAIVLGVAAAIFAGAFAVDSLRPTDERTNTTFGKDTVEVHQLGKGGIKPGPVQPRVIPTSKPTVAPTAPAGVSTASPKPVKTATAVPTVAPTQPTSGGGLIPGTGPQDPNTEPCGLLNLGKCPKEEPDDSTPTGQDPDPGATATPGPGSTDTAAGGSDKVSAPDPR